MVFPSIPIYEDPSNWNQQQPHALGTNTSNLTRSDNNANQLSPIALASNPVPNLFAPDPTSHTPGQIHLTQFPHPESGLKCPRCDSTNTKFCYFNNYSLSQPRHFCRTCRRYWTRGGTLRNVPVGGGSRRNKKWPRATTSTATSARTGKHLQFNSNTHHIGISHSLGTDFGTSNVGIGVSGIQLQFQQFPFTGAFETAQVLPIQLGVTSHLDLSSKNEELQGVCINAGGSSMRSNSGSQGSLLSFISSSAGSKGLF